MSPKTVTVCSVSDTADAEIEPSFVNDATPPPRAPTATPPKDRKPVFVVPVAVITPLAAFENVTSLVKLLLNKPKKNAAETPKLCVPRALFHATVPEFVTIISETARLPGIPICDPDVVPVRVYVPRFDTVTFDP